MELFRSRGNQQHAYRAIAAMRKEFGDHPYGEDEGVRKQRVTSRVGNESRESLERDDKMDLVGPVDENH